MTQTHHVQMVKESSDAIQNLRRSLIQLYGVVGADPALPQDVARRFSVNRNLTWKLARVIGESDPFLTLRHLPGTQGMDLALKAFEVGGAPKTAIDNVQDAIRSFGDVIRRYADDRDQFELTLESMGLFQSESRPESGRELAFRGNSMVWGVQARTRFAAGFIGPSSASTHHFDYVFIGGLAGFRRLRPSARWRLFRLQVRDDTGAMVAGPNGPEEIFAKPPGETPLILSKFCSTNMPPIDAVPGQHGMEFVLPEGDVGNIAAFDCTFGYIIRNLTAIRDAENARSSLAAPITLPVETLVFDIIRHKDMQMAGEFEFGLYGFPHGGADNPTTQTPQNLLPITCKPVVLPGSPPALDTPLVPNYSALATSVFERMNWNAANFIGVRFQLSFPPMATTAVVGRPLPELS